MALLTGAGRAGMCATTLITLSGCTGALSTIDPAGPHARSVATMWWMMLGGAVILAGLVFVLLALAGQNELLPPHLQNPLLASMVLSMLATPLLILSSNRIVMRLAASDWLL
ncbi:hypothetical protein, partial [Salmonella enterica]|uniref:hypothetical protein n=1 Tax=Salmonella enterica TaxID=28901 RepID=UPI003FD8BD41